MTYSLIAMYVFMILAATVLIFCVKEWIRPLYNRIHKGYYFEKNASVSGYVFVSTVYTAAFLYFTHITSSIAGKIMP